MEHKTLCRRFRDHMKLLLCTLFLTYFSYSYAQKVEVIKMPQLQEIIEGESDQIKVINFWASWCGPCVKELPYFDEISENALVDVTLVSLDFPQDVKKAETILKKKNIATPSFLLDEKNYIDQIDTSWSGAIPATLIVDNKGNRYFSEKAFSKDELVKLIQDITSK